MSRVDRSRLPELKPERSFRFPEFLETRFPNGLEARMVVRTGLPLVTLIVLIPVGSSADPAGFPGLASLTGDMLDEGSGERSAIDIHEEIARIGGELEIDVGADATTVSLTTLSRHVARGIGLLADLVVHPRLADEDVDRVRRLRLDRLAQLRESPPAIADRAFIHFLYRDHPYGHAPIGTEASLAQLTPIDVRKFHDERYAPAGATLVAVGDIEADTMVRIIDAAMGAWHIGHAAPPRGDGHRLPPHVRHGAMAVIDRPGAAQSELRIGLVGPARKTPDYHALLVLNAILGGQFVSRVNLNLRERKGYTYGARTSFDFRTGRGPFYLQTAVDTRATGDAVREAIGEIAGIRGDRPATPQELALGRAALTRGYPRSFETAGQIARGAVQLALYDLPNDYFETFVPAIEQVGVDEVTRAAERHIDPALLSTLIVGDDLAIRAGLIEAGLGEPLPIAPV